ncbi:MAG: pyridoxal phosphate-dependent decarboxylase family protein [Betaproteobacteria bacterium]
MSEPLDKEFLFDSHALQHAIELMGQHFAPDPTIAIPSLLPEDGVGSLEALERLAPSVLGGATRLGDALAFAHKDPPTPWVTWATTLWNASLNQNLLHPETAPVARQIEERVLDWLCPYFGMQGGHMTPGSSAANLTALWAARECAGIREIVASEAAHLSIKKAAHILGLAFRSVRVDSTGALCSDDLPTDLSRSALVLTSGTTSVGALDSLGMAGRAAWTHVDAAWGGPLRLTCHADRLSGIEHADSVAVSSHKWLFQPKESALIMFRNVAKAHEAISFGGSYLSEPNIGLLGSHGATAIPLLAMLWSWGRVGVAKRIEHCVQMADTLAQHFSKDSRVELLGQPQTAIVVWRPCQVHLVEQIVKQLPVGMASTVTINNEKWIRHTATNPNADIVRIIQAITFVLDQT